MMLFAAPLLTSLLAMSSSTIPTSELLSTLIDAARHGSATIRSTGSASSGEVVYKEEGEARSAMTVADTAAQKIICASLQKALPELKIVGEEDESVVVDEGDAVSLSGKLKLDFVAGEYDELMPKEVKFSDLCVYVDPLDGTREFVEGRLQNVQCLIGLTHRGYPLMGAIGLPFAEKVEVAFGLVGRGVGKVEQGDDGNLIKSPMDDFETFDADAATLSSGDSNSPLLLNSIKAIEDTVSPLERQIMGACGNKILKVIHGESTLSVMHHKTSLWDTAAPTALLKAVGGKVTDLFGQPLVYPDEVKELGNKLGVLCSMKGAAEMHAKIAAAMRANSGVLKETFPQVHLDENDNGGQCVDIVRDLDGYPLQNAFFEVITGEKISSFSCPETEAVRGLMSNACRVHFNGSSTQPKSAFYKRIDFAQLDHARDKLRNAPHKLVRDVKSYQVETSFLSSKACRLAIDTTGVQIPKCLHAQLQPNDDDPIESKFSILLQDFSPSDKWSQRWLLRTKEECYAALDTFAKMHAFFWAGSDFWKNEKDAAEELVNSVWKSASYVQPALQTLNQCQQVQSGWLKKRENCREELQDFEWWDTLGTRLEQVAEQAGKETHPFHEEESSTDKYDEFKTLIHGDPKQTNIFFKDGSDGLEVGLIDFQWAGFGLAASDIAHHLVAAVHADLLVDGGEKELLKYYYDRLTKNLVLYGAYENAEQVHEKYSFQGVFIKQYDTAVLDLCRLVIAYAWSRFERVTDDAGYARTMNKNSYNKSLPNVIWLMCRCDKLLNKRELAKTT